MNLLRKNRDSAKKNNYKGFNPFLIVSFVLLIMYLLPFIILRENASFPVNDNLDWITSWIVLVNSGQVFTLDAIIPSFMGGIPRYCLPSGLNVITWLYMLFEPFTAYFINFLLVHIFAFIGFYLLLDTYVLKENIPCRNLIIAGTSLCFSILPFYTVYGLSIAGQPLLAYAFLNIYHERKFFMSLFLIAFFAFYSFLPLCGIFVLVALGLIVIADIFKNRVFRKKFVFSVFFLGFCYFISEIWLIYSILFVPEFASSRLEIDRIALGQVKSFRGVLRTIYTNFISGQYHAVSLHYYILFFVVPLGMLSALFIRDKASKLLYFLLGVSVLISCWYGFRYSYIFVEIARDIPLLNSFQIQRFHWFHPFLWYVIFALSLACLSRIKYLGKILILAFIMFQASYLFANNIEYNMWLKEKEILDQESTVKENTWFYENITYREFYSEELFQKVADYIGTPKEDYYVLNIGLYPAITQYNGFYTLDGRLNIYPLDYKHKFRKIFEKELEKNSFWKNYFDNWGITCYVFPAELQYLQIRKSYKSKLENLELNSEAIKDLNGKYVFSALEILNYKENNLKFLTKISVESSPWEIYIYEVN